MAVQVNCRELQALIDTGASISIMRLKEFDIETKETKISDLRFTKIVVANAQEIKISGTALLFIRAGEVTIPQKFYVAPSLCRSMIFGRDWSKRIKQK